MNDMDLSELIDAMEAGTRLHVCLAFPSSARGLFPPLPRHQLIHAAAFCNRIKQAEGKLSECYRIREKHLQQILEEKQVLTVRCPFGICEYLHPILRRGKLICTVMISSLTPEDGADPNFLSVAKVKARVLERQIQSLLQEAELDRRETDPFAAQVEALLGDARGERISVREMAQSLGYHEKYLSAKFKQKTGQTPRAWQNRRRLEQAEGYLRNTDLPIIEIASLTGFDNVSYFNRLFRARNGLTPSEYRKQKRNAALKGPRRSKKAE